MTISSPQPACFDIKSKDLPPLENPRMKALAGAFSLANPSVDLAKIKQKIAPIVEAAENASDPKVFKKEIAKIRAFWKQHTQSTLEKDDQHTPQAAVDYQKALHRLSTFPVYLRFEPLHDAEKRAILAAKCFELATRKLNPFLKDHSLDFSDKVVRLAFGDMTIDQAKQSIQTTWSQAISELSPQQKSVINPKVFTRGITELKKIQPRKLSKYRYEGEKNVQPAYAHIAFVMQLLMTTIHIFSKHSLKTEECSPAFQVLQETLNRFLRYLCFHLSHSYSGKETIRMFRNEQMQTILDLRIMVGSKIKNTGILRDFYVKTKSVYDMLEKKQPAHNLFTSSSKNAEFMQSAKVLALDILKNLAFNSFFSESSCVALGFLMKRVPLPKKTRQQYISSILETLARSPLPMLRPEAKDLPKLFANFTHIVQSQIDPSDKARALVAGIYSTVRSSWEQKDKIHLIQTFQRQIAVVLDFHPQHPRKTLIAYLENEITKDAENNVLQGLLKKVQKLIQSKGDEEINQFLDSIRAVQEEIEKTVQMSLAASMYYLKDTREHVHILKIYAHVGSSISPKQHMDWKNRLVKPEKAVRAYLNQLGMTSEEKPLLQSWLSASKDILYGLHSLLFLGSKIAPFSVFTKGKKTKKQPLSYTTKSNDEEALKKIAQKEIEDINSWLQEMSTLPHLPEKQLSSLGKYARL